MTQMMVTKPTRSVPKNFKRKGIETKAATIEEPWLIKLSNAFLRML
jgi:hypothetical protein